MSTLRYRFKGGGAGGTAFTCDMQCVRCEGVTRRGTQCSKRVCIGTPLCWQHLLASRGVRIRPSTVPGAGKGLFAMARPRPRPRRRGGHAQNDRGAASILFRPGDVIAEYDGEVVAKAELDRRYGDHTAPYGIHVRGEVYEDGACRRGTAAMANHATGTGVNARFSYRYAARNAGAPVRSVLRATRPIRDGEEILVNYGDDYEFERDVTSATYRGRRRL